MQNHYEFPFIKSIYDLLDNIGEIDKDDIIGCSEDELAHLEDLHPYKIKLPAAYKAFMKHFGKKIINMQPVSIFFYPQIVAAWSDPSIGLRLYNNDFFHRKFTPLSNPALLFPANAFAFAVHEGYQFRFFYCEETDDPQTYFIEYDPEGKDFDKDILYSDLMIGYVKIFIQYYEDLINQNHSKKNDFFIFKKMFSDLMNELEELNLKRSLIEGFSDTYDLYHAIDIYDILKNRSFFLGAYYGLDSTDPEIKASVDNFFTKAKRLENFYREFLK